MVVTETFVRPDPLGQVSEELRSLGRDAGVARDPASGPDVRTAQGLIPSQFLKPMYPINPNTDPPQPSLGATRQKPKERAFAPSSGMARKEVFGTCLGSAPLGYQSLQVGCNSRLGLAKGR